MTSDDPCPHASQAHARTRSPFTAFALGIAATSLPFYALDPLTSVELLPKLPISSLVVVCPSVVALGFTYRSRGTSGLKALVSHTLQWRGVAPAWTALALLLRPSATWLSYWLPAALAGSVSLTPFTHPSSVGVSAASFSAVLFIGAAFLAGAVAEEIGWTSYALGQLRASRSTLAAGVQIGSVWAAWHVPPLLSAGRSVVWISWWGLGTIATRVLWVWMYRATGGAAATVTLSHALHNVVWMSIPTYGSHYDPRADALATLVVTVAALAASKYLPWLPAPSRHVPPTASHDNP